MRSLPVVVLAAGLMSVSPAVRAEVFDASPTSTNAVALPSGSSQENIVKSLHLDYSAESNQVFVVGTLHGAVGVVSVGPTAPAYTGSGQLGSITAYDAHEAKLPVADPARSRIWTVGMTAGSSKEHNLFVSDSGTLSVLAETHHASSSYFPTPPGSKYPVRSAVVDPRSGYLYAATEAGKDPCKPGQEGKGAVRQVIVWRHASSSLSVIGCFEPTSASERILELVWNGSTDAAPVRGTQALAMLLHDDDSGEDRVLFAFVPTGTPYVTSSISYKSCTLTQSGFTHPVGLLAIDDAGDLYVAGATAVAKLAFNAGGDCTLLSSATSRSLCQNPTDMAVDWEADDEAGSVALLYKYDESPTLTATPFAGTVDAVFSWADLYAVDGDSLAYARTWRAGLESGSIVATSADDRFEFAVGAGGAGTVWLLPRNHSARPTPVQLSTSPEYPLLTEDSGGNQKILTLSRLAGSQLIVTPADGSGSSCHYRGPKVVGLWSVGIAKSRDWIYILSHHDRRLHVLNRQKVADCDPGVKAKTVELRALGGNPDYQVGDSLSALASDARGRLHVALLNVAGELHFIDCRRGPCGVAQSEQILPREVNLGAGRVQAAVKVDPGTKLSTVFVHQRDEEELDVWTEDESGVWSRTGVAVVRGSDLYGDIYAIDSLLYSRNTPGRLYLYNRIYDISGAVPVYLESVSSSVVNVPAEDDDQEPEPEPAVLSLLHRVIAVEPSGELWGNYFRDSTDEELLRKVRKDDNGSWQVEDSYSLFPTYAMRSGFHMDYQRASTLSHYDAVFSQPHEGLLYFRDLGLTVAPKHSP